jgi:hypothetical protein
LKHLVLIWFVQSAIFPSWPTETPTIVAMFVSERLELKVKHEFLVKSNKTTVKILIVHFVNNGSKHC